MKRFICLSIFLFFACNAIYSQYTLTSKDSIPKHFRSLNYVIDSLSNVLGKPTSINYQLIIGSNLNNSTYYTTDKRFDKNFYIESLNPNSKFINQKNVYNPHGALNVEGAIGLGIANEILKKIGLQ